MVLPDIPRRNAKLYPDKIAVVSKYRKYTFKELDRRINQLSNIILSLGVKKGDRVAILSKNSTYYLEIPYAILKAGAIVVTINYRLKEKEISYIIEDSGAKTLITTDEFIDNIGNLRNRLKNIIVIGNNIPEYTINYEDSIAGASSYDPDIEIDKDEVAFYLYTSGTTGVPKGVMLTHNNFIVSAKNFIMETPILFNDVYLAAMPLYHSVITLLHAFFMRGCTSVIVNFDPEEILSIIEREKVTKTMLVPTMINMLCECKNINKYDLKSLDTILYAASPMPLPLLKKGISIFGNIFYQMYGLTESTTLCTTLTKEEHKGERIKSIGREIMTVRVRIVDENDNNLPAGEIGEIIVKGDNLMKGYLNRPKDTGKVIRNGWLRTGDMGWMDRDGYIYLVDRKDDMIISGGVNIYPKEIEDVIISYSKVKDVGVIGIPDEKWGEAIKAFVVIKEECSEEEILNYCKKNLASFKKPKYIEFVDELPRDLAGKLNRKLLKEKG
jgi:O-succinylbenzoate-CoA ligase